jgi:predicted transcriptional regulator of viral defense system
LFRHSARAEDAGMATNVLTGSSLTLAAIARRQKGLVTIAQLKAVGLSTSAVRKRVQRGVLHWVHRGVYSLSPALSHEARCLAAVLAAGEGAGLGHLAAANAWELRPSKAISVIAPRRCRIRGVVAHHIALDPCDLTVRNGVPVTTPARTYLDIATVLPALEVANAMHEGAFRRRFDEQAIRARPPEPAVATPCSSARSSSSAWAARGPRAPTRPASWPW